MSTETERLLGELLTEFKRNSSNSASTSKSKAKASSRNSTLDLAESKEDVANASKGLAGSMGIIAGRVGTLGKNFGDVAESSNSLSRVFGILAGSGAFGALLGSITDQVDVYKSFISVGQTFNGSMMNMSIAAADSYQSVESFAKAVKEGGAAVTSMGVQQFSALSGAIRENIMQHGSYGLAIDEANGFLTDQLETQRILGITDSMNNQKQIKNYNDLQKSTIALAGITGKARDQIIKMTMELQKAPELIGYMAGLPKEMRADVKKSVQQAMNVFASLPDDVAQKLGSGLTEGLALGSSYISESMGDMVALAPNVTSAMENVRKIAASGGDTTEASIQVVKNLQNMSQSQMANLSQWASAGDASAKELLKMAGGVKGLRIEEMRRDADRKKLFGGAETEFMNFGQNMQMLWSMMKGGMMKFFQPVLKLFNSGLGEGAGIFKSFNDKIKEWSEDGGLFERWGKALAAFIQDSWPKIEEGFNDFIKWIGEALTDLRAYFAEFDFAKLLKGVGSGLLAIGGAITTVVGAFTWVGEAIGNVFGSEGGGGFIGSMLGVSAIVLTLLNPFKMLGLAIQGLMTVISSGSKMAKAAFKFFKGGGVGKLKDKVSKKLGSTGATMAAKTATTKAGSSAVNSSVKAAAKASGKVSKTVLKSALKKIPFVGLVAALSFAAGRAGSGDFVGAGLEVLSGAASTLPGVGTAASVAIDAGLLARDLSRSSGGMNAEVEAVMANKSTNDEVPAKITQLIALTEKGIKVQEDQANGIKALIMQDGKISEQESRLMKQLGIKITENS